MKKYALCTFLTFIMFSPLHSQNPRRDWSDGKLTWNDFVVKNSDTEISGFRFMLEYKTAKQKGKDTTVYRFETYSYIDLPVTWATPESRNEQHLRYHQIMFDLAESYRRTLQNRLDRVGSVYEADNILQSITNDYQTEINRIKHDSKDGQNMKTIVLWEQIVANRLAKLPENALPEYSVGSFGYGMHIGLGSSVYAGNVGSYFSPALFLNYGFDFSYKKSNIMLSAILGGNGIKKSIVSEPGWYSGKNSGFAIGDISYGYTLFDNNKFRIIPFAGFGFFEQTTASAERLYNVNMLAGVTGYYKFRHWLNFLPDPLIGVREISEASLRARLFVSGVNYGNNLNGASINFSISISGGGKFMKLKE